MRFFVEYGTRKYEFLNNCYMRMVREIFPGETIGEQAIIKGDNVRVATIRACERSLCFTLLEEHYNSLIGD